MRRAPSPFRYVVVTGAIAWVTVVTAIAQAQPYSDDTPPVLVGLAVTPSTIDTGGSGATVAVSAQVTDAQSGTSVVYVQVRHDSGQSQGATLTRTAGSAADGTYEGTLPFPQLSAAGGWNLLLVLEDALGNRRDLHADDLALLGFPATLGNTASTDDHAPPTLASLVVTPTTIDTDGAGATVTVTAQVTDAVAGVADIYVQFRHPSGESHGVSLPLTSGTAANGTYEETFAFPQLSAAGEWSLLVVLRDALGNRRDLHADDLTVLGLPATLSNTASTDDATPPTLVAFSVTPTTIDTGGTGATVTVTAHVTDAPSGVAAVYGQFRHPSGQRRGIDLALTSGTAGDGVYEGTFAFPQSSAAGGWTLLVVLQDALGNRRDLLSDDLTVLGFTAGLTNDPTAPAPTPTATATAAPVTPTPTSTPGGLGFLGSRVNALAVSGTDLYVGGDIDSVGGEATAGIAKWDGTAWSTLGSGVLGDVLAIAVDGSDVYAGGQFFEAGGVPASRVAKWDGTSWSALGGGLPGTVYSLAIIGGELHATTHGQVAQSHVAKWDGTNWVGLVRVDSPLYAIAEYSGVPYVVGDFESISTRLAWWDGGTWNLLGPSLGSIATALVPSGSNLFAGGHFANSNGGPANYVARWDGTSWHALGTGMDARVRALAVDGGDLYAGGDFSVAGGVPADFVARWDGTSWHALGSGVNADVQAVAVVGSDVYVGGFHTQAGGQAAHRIARWDGTSWHPLLEQPPVCGNGSVEGGEACDQGAANGTAGSCCTSSCQLRPAGQECRALQGVCDVAELCSGASATCPADAKSTAVCRAAANACDVVESCDGLSNGCPANDIGNGLPCDDGNACTLGDVCSGGGCAGGAARDCNDGNACTNDGCNPGSGCTHADNTAPCEDGLFCTVADVCAGGTCAGGTARDCSGSADQCNAGACDETHDRCAPAPLADGTPCDDGGACTSGAQCTSGTCSGIASSGCGDGIVDATCAEQCDDGAPASGGDGCSPACTVEAGWACTGAPSVCRVTCGDGVYEPSAGETCDDGDLGGDDGCGPTCAIEPGWHCPTSVGSTSICTPICGDGRRLGDEQCDVGDADDGDGDGCEANCTLTPKSPPPVTAVPGGTVRSDIENDGATALDPLETAVTTPTGGEISITRRPANGAAAAGYGLLGQEVDITAPSATAEDPLRFAFTLDPSLAPGLTPGDVPVFRNGVLVPACSGPSGQASPNPCVESRTLLANGEDIEIVVLTSTASIWTFAVDLCGSAPSGDCRAPIASGKASLQIKNASDPAKDALQWKWLKGAATTVGDLGDPTTSTDYTLCVYDANGLALRLAVPPSGTCGTKPCWAAKPGAYAYKDKLGSADGVVQLQLKAGVPAGRAKIQLKGKGAALGLPAALGLVAPVTTQLRSADTCWQATYGAPSANDPGQFKAKSD